MTDQVHDQSIAGTAKDNIPTMSKTMDEVHDNPEDISNKASGYKATISNPNVSDSAKKNAKEMLGELGGEDAFMKNNGKGE